MSARIVTSAILALAALLLVALAPTGAAAHGGAAHVHALKHAGLLGVMAVMSIGNSFATPTLNAMASRCGTLQTQGETMGAMSSAGSFGRFLGPFITGNILWFLPSHFDYAFWLAAVIMAVAGFMVLRIRSAAPPAA